MSRCSRIERRSRSKRRKRPGAAVVRAPVAWGRCGWSAEVNRSINLTLFTWFSRRPFNRETHRLALLVQGTVGIIPMARGFIEVGATPSALRFLSTHSLVNSTPEPKQHRANPTKFVPGIPVTPQRRA